MTRFVVFLADVSGLPKGTRAFGEEAEGLLDPTSTRDKNEGESRSAGGGYSLYA